jgi:ABC-type dipeptide/oligopeptide/nickel transport system permease subunit
VPPHSPDLPVQTATQRRSVPKTLLRHPSGLFGISVLGCFVFAALVSPVLLPFDPAQNHLEDAFLPRSSSHPLGTDQLGRDELRALLYGARYTLALGLLAVAIGVGIGAPLGAISGYFGGWIDLVIQRVTDILLSFPAFLLALGLIAALGVGLRNVVIAVGVSSVPGFVRLVRSQTLSIRELPFVDASRSLGGSSHRILAKHILPNAAGPIIVQATLQLGYAIIVASGLGFLGLGVQPPAPEWGALLGQSQQYIFSDPMLATYPGLAIFLTVLAFNLLGDGLRDALDARHAR